MIAQPITAVDENQRRWRGAVLPAALILLWWAASQAGVVNSALLVSPAKVLETAADQIFTGKLWRAWEPASRGN